jgi:hypothetical protein
MTVNLVKAKAKDSDLIIELLRQNNLPYQDIKAETKTFS